MQVSIHAEIIKCQKARTLIVGQTQFLVNLNMYTFKPVVAMHQAK